MHQFSLISKNYGFAYSPRTKVSDWTSRHCPEYYIFCAPVANGYRGRLAADVNNLFGSTLDCVKSNHGTTDFIPYNGRWVVERTIAWMDNFRRLARNYEQHLHTAESMARLAMIAVLLNKL